MTLSEPTVAGTTEILSLANSGSNVLLIAASAHEGDVDACLESAIDFVADNEDYRDVEPVLDEAGDPIEGRDDDLAFTTLGFTDADGANLAVHLECRELVPGESTIQFDQFMAASNYEDQVAPRVDLLDGLEIEAS
jgi:hypothetical protein